jgi:ATP-dependent RNA helicase DDX23/PRP28
VLNQCNYVVLDEADRMIDMGFEPQVVSILDEMPSTNLRPIHEEEVETNRTYRQTFMFSATMPPSVERLTRQYLRNPVYVTIGDPNSTAAERVRQTIIWTNENEKRKKLKNMMESMEPPIMVFCNMKKGADSLAKFLRTQEWKALSLHGGKKQDLRQQNLEMFKENIIDVLVCTNVAGRGIDIKGVEHVINYDMPNNIQGLFLCFFHPFF